MSTDRNFNRKLADFAEKYCRVFGLPPGSAEYEKWEDGEGKVWCPTRDDLPVWYWNQTEAEYRRAK